MSFLDLILIAYLLYMFFSGYSKGFFSTLYDLLSFIIMMLFIYFNVETISSIIQIYKPVDGSLTVVSNFLLTKSLKTLIISMLLSFFIVKFVKINVLIWANVCYNRHRR